MPSVRLDSRYFAHVARGRLTFGHGRAIGFAFASLTSPIAIFCWVMRPGRRGATIIEHAIPHVRLGRRRTVGPRLRWPTSAPRGEPPTCRVGPCPGEGGRSGREQTIVITRWISCACAPCSASSTGAGAAAAFSAGPVAPARSGWRRRSPPGLLPPGMPSGTGGLRACRRTRRRPRSCRPG